MPNFRRNYETGGTFFLTVCLKDRQSNLLTEEIDDFREAYKSYKPNGLSKRRPAVFYPITSMFFGHYQKMIQITPHVSDC
jgi:hypothetical protein